MSEPMSVEEAQQTVLSAVGPGPIVRLSLGDALYRTLAEPLASDLDYPPFDRAVMDGFAVRAADAATLPAALEAIGEVAAGDVPRQPVAARQAVRINTGAPIPAGSDAIVPIEEVELTGNGLTLRNPVQPGQHIARKGEYARQSQTVLPAGTLLSAGQLGIAAAIGAATVTVYEQPTVAILVTGSELVDVEHTPRGAQIRDSNRYVLDGLIRQAHCRTMDLGSVGDDRDALIERIRQGLAIGFLCITGGVSMGQHDLVPDCLKACGARIVWHKLAIKPGKPALFATTDDGAYVFALPGNPVSVFVTFLMLVRPALARREGRERVLPALLAAMLVGGLGPTSARQTYWPARVTVDEHGRFAAQPLSWRGSGDPFGLETANALIVTAPGTPSKSAGQQVEVVLFDLM